MFTPIHTTLGSLLLFQGSSGLLIHNGAIFGISSLISGSVFNPSSDNVPIVAGLMSSVIPVYLLAPSLIPNYPHFPVSWNSAAATLAVGFLLGWGTKNGRGCTSGHMLCGLSRLSARSLIATTLFFSTALITANVFGDTVIPTCDATPCYLPIYPSRSESIFMIASLLLASLANHIVPKILQRSKESKTMFAYLAGLEFGLGLLISGMADANKVLGFFALPTDWARFDPSLALIIVFGIGPSLMTYLSKKPGRSSGKEKPAPKPTLVEQWRLPTATVADIDWRFVAGAMAFGVAWGLRGTCPGPALLRSTIQPMWGLLTMSGCILGNLL
ncbi:hypothetical protein N7492_009482 [Penicillium capsulatum]|uniref:YeeE/YedE family integral membrane protein n=1 Tax=Penicillium capsulatum TaxID=69766 RepID=A0A9W9HX77_9EURO|nr:hypothetical protein N7492_009482 [Penicillium capsulatum]KAJ6106872.1 hypothetical protein N7512_010389 [Penicillium capsulatum]